MTKYRFTTYRKPEWSPDRKPIPLLQHHSVAAMADAILQHNTNNGFTGVNFIGESGTGKSTVMNTLIHRIHQKKEYAVHWFSDYDMTKLVEILDRLPKAPTILIFDDATDSFHDLKDSEIKKIAKKLTRVRHDVQAPVILFIAFHYSRALEKIFRNVSIKIMTSISDEEFVNYAQLFRSTEGYKLKQFERIYYNQTFHSTFSFSLSQWTGQKLVYKTNDPFRCALVAGVGKLRFMLYPAESCNKCASDAHRTKTQTLTPQEMIELLQKTYSNSLIMQVLRQYLYSTKSIDMLPTNYRSLWNRLSYIDKNFFIDWEKVGKQSEISLKTKRKKGYNFTKKATLLKKELEEKAKNKMTDTDKNSKEGNKSQNESPDS